MQHQPHNTIAKRFFVNGHGELIDRARPGTNRRTGYSITANRATRTEIQILADLLNEPAHAQAFDAGAGDGIHHEWAARIVQSECAARCIHQAAQELRHAA